MKLFKLTTLVLIFMAPINANAFTGNEFLSHCQGLEDANDQFRTGLCLGFIRGITSGHIITIGFLNTISKNEYLRDHAYIYSTFFCIDDKVTMGQLAKVAIKYMNENPERLNLDATFLLHEAYFHAFPCDELPITPSK